METNLNKWHTTWNYSRKRKLVSYMNKKRKEKLYQHIHRQNFACLRWLR